MLSVFRPLFKELGVDLGTANTVIFLNKNGFIINEPSVVALDQNNKTFALGKEAKEMRQNW